MLQQKPIETIVIEDEEDDEDENDDSEEYSEEEDDDPPTTPAVRQRTTSNNDQTDIGSCLIELFDQAQASGGGNFTCGGVLDCKYGLPGLEVAVTSENGSTQYKAVGLPITTKEQALELIQHCSKAPYGKGEATIYDDAVRKSWQLNPDQFRFANVRWNQLINDLVNEKVKGGLGIIEGTPVHCTLYKLLLYEEEGHFDFHRDTEKEDKMFATLVIQLPSVYSGGEIIVKHGTREEKYDFSKDASFTPFFFSFYSDCQHRVCPVTSGYRLCLVYNVVYSGNNTVPSLIDNSTQLTQLANTVAAWKRKPETPFFVYLLDHKYSQAGLRFGCLKGDDAAKFRLLEQYIAKHNDLTLYLAIMKKTEKGYPTGYDIYDEDECEITETEFEISDVIDMDDEEVDITLELDESDIIPEEVLEGLDIEGSEIEESTGNAGASVERWYRNACFIIYPNQFENFLALRMGTSHACDVLRQLFIEHRSNPTPTSKNEVTRFLEALLQKEDKSSTQTLASYIVELDDLNLCKLLISRKGEKIIGTELLTLVKHFGLDTLKATVVSLISNEFTTYWGRVTDSLSFLDALGDANFITQVFQTIGSGIKRLTSDQVSAIVGLHEKYHVPLADGLKKTLITALNTGSSSSEIKNIFSVAERVKEFAWYELVLEKAWSTPSPNMYQMSSQPSGNDSCDLETQIIVKCVENIGWELSKKKLYTYIDNYIEYNTKKAADALRVFNLIPSDTARSILVAMAHRILKYAETHTLLIETIVKLMMNLYDCGLQGELTALAQWIITHIASYDVICVVRPVIVDVSKHPSITSTGMQMLVEYCIQFLSPFFRSGMLPSVNWSMPTACMSCKCDKCSLVQRFLYSAKDTTYTVSARESDRSHVESIARRATEDLDFQTLKVGSPHKLVITKVCRSTEMQKRHSAIGHDTMKFLQSLLVPRGTVHAASSSDQSLAPPTKKVKNE